MQDPGLVGRSPEGLDSLHAQASAAQAPVVQSVNGLGAVASGADLVPVVLAELNAGQIIAVSHLKDVVAIYDIPQAGLMNDDSATSDRYPFVWATASGSGVQVAVHEDDGVDNVNTFLNNATHSVVYWSDTQAGLVRNIQQHATNVAGVIASTHNWRRGGAFGIGQILSANFQSFSSANQPKMVNSASWAVSNGADTINMSWGTICSLGNQSFFSRWVDFLVKSTGVNVVASAGNSTCSAGTPQFVGAPSLGWNTLSAGSYFDNNTGLRTDDVLSSFTSFVNPTDPNSGRTYEKPDVTGMGGQVAGGACFGTETTGIGGGVNDSTCGTSFSAPDTSALTAVVMGKQPALIGAAEAVKAIAMASATHNIVDGVNYRDCAGSPTSNDCRDGAGAIDAFQAITNVVTPGNWAFPGLISPASFDASGNINFTTTLTKGKNTRAVIAWDSTAACTNLGTTSQACSSDVLNADLDLSVLDPNGVSVASAASFQNSAEVVDFKPAITGTYTIRVHNFRFDAGTNTFLGVAWNKNIADSRTPATGVKNFALNTTKTNQTNDKGVSFWDTYSGPAASCASFLNPETGLEKMFKVTTSATGQITASLSSIVAFSGVSSDVDAIILKKSGPANAQNGQVVACGDTTAVASAQPAGTYYILVDGFSGSVAKYSLTVNFVAGAVASPQEPLPPRKAS
jgi:hypothetical protein